MATRPRVDHTCALGDVHGCQRPSEYAVFGPVYGPPSLRPSESEAAPGAGFVATGYPCAEHLAEVVEWFYEPEVVPVYEFEDLLALGMWEQIFGDVDTVTLRARASA